MQVPAVCSQSRQPFHFLSRLLLATPGEIQSDCTLRQLSPWQTTLFHNTNMAESELETKPWKKCVHAECKTIVCDPSVHSLNQFCTKNWFIWRCSGLFLLIISVLQQSKRFAHRSSLWPQCCMTSSDSPLRFCSLKVQIRDNGGISRRGSSPPNECPLVQVLFVYLVPKFLLLSHVFFVSSLITSPAERIFVWFKCHPLITSVVFSQGKSANLAASPLLLEGLSVVAWLKQLEVLLSHWLKKT